MTIIFTVTLGNYSGPSMKLILARYKYSGSCMTVMGYASLSY